MATSESFNTYWNHLLFSDIALLENNASIAGKLAAKLCDRRPVTTFTPSTPTSARKPKVVSPVDLSQKSPRVSAIETIPLSLTLSQQITTPTSFNDFCLLRNITIVFRSQLEQLSSISRRSRMRMSRWAGNWTKKAFNERDWNLGRRNGCEKHRGNNPMRRRNRNT